MNMPFWKKLSDLFDEKVKDKKLPALTFSMLKLAVILKSVEIYFKSTLL